MFCFAFLPQFVPAGDPQALPRMLLLSTVFLLMAFVVLAAYGASTAPVRTHLVLGPVDGPGLRALPLSRAGSRRLGGGRLESVTVLDRPLDLVDLLATPDDGNRYEVLDGALVMTPPPGTRHQHVVLELAVLLREAARPLGLRTFVAPVAWRIGPGQVPEPDLVVAAEESVGDRAVTGAPLLVVEVVSPIGRDRDLHDRRRIYARGGAPRYWLVEPEVPRLAVLRLAGETYEEHAVVEGASEFATDQPLPVRVVPADLLTCQRSEALSSARTSCAVTKRNPRA
ncbi:MAG: Uma2 family endonuclease [Actinomycetota bacterium]|nr:Uma2 family endonuclease [Actinomycetota bacterium]